jgi:hypothetical protein
MLKTADGDDDNESSMINSAKRPESDETYYDYDRGEKETPDTSLDSKSDARTDGKGSQTMLRPLLRSLEEDEKSDPVFTDRETIALSGSSAGSKEDHVAEEEKMDDEGVTSVEKMALPFPLDDTSQSIPSRQRPLTIVRLVDRGTRS